MDVAALLLELFGRIPPLAESTIDGLDPAALAAPPRPGTNPIGWLVWHLIRVQDHHVAELMDTDQIWTTSDWPHRFGLDADPHNTGYGHTAAEVAQVRPDSTEPWSATSPRSTRTRAMLATLGTDDLERIVDRRWDPPVTLGVRLVSIADDSLQHLGQAAYAADCLER